MTCPICTKESDKKYKPFCSRRCADVDLGKWLTGRYSIPSNELEDMDEAVEPPAEPPAKPGDLLH